VSRPALDDLGGQRPQAFMGDRIYVLQQAVFKVVRVGLADAGSDGQLAAVG
jgi:hypothetical protein